MKIRRLLPHAAVLACAILFIVACQDSPTDTNDEPVDTRLSVAFDSQGGGSVSAAKVQPGETLVEPLDLTNATDANLVFSGWYTEAACSTRWNFDDPVAKGMTLYAKWNAANSLTFAAISGGAAWEVSKGSGSLDSDLYIPAYYKGIPVTSVASSGFTLCTGLTKVVLPPGMKSIKSSAFCRSNLSSVTLPQGIEELGVNAFTTTNIGRIRIPASCTSVAASAISNCKSLSQVTVDAENPQYVAVDNVLFNKSMTSLICYPAGRAGTNYSIPAGVIEIAYCAFLGSSLVGIAIPDGVTTLSNNAFAECPSLHEINIPASVNFIGNLAFGMSFYWTASTIYLPNTVSSLGYWAFYGCASLSIRCQAAAQPAGWDALWNPDGRPVAWDCAN
jgi:uncharacterized repeat protein (TIGR02543 family)